MLEAALRTTVYLENKHYQRKAFFRTSLVQFIIQTLSACLSCTTDKCFNGSFDISSAYRKDSFHDKKQPLCDVA